MWLLKKIVIIEKDHDYWKRLWLLKKIVMIEKDCDNWKRFWTLKNLMPAMRWIEVIETVLNSLSFFYEKISHAPKSTKSTEKHQKTPNAQRSTKMQPRKCTKTQIRQQKRNALKNI